MEDSSSRWTATENRFQKAGSRTAAMTRLVARGSLLDGDGWSVEVVTKIEDGNARQVAREVKTGTTNTLQCLSREESRCWIEAVFRGRRISVIIKGATTLKNERTSMTPSSTKE